MPGDTTDEKVGDSGITDTVVEVFVGVFVGKAEFPFYLVVMAFLLRFLDLVVMAFLLRFLVEQVSLDLRIPFLLTIPKTACLHVSLLTARSAC